MMGRYSWNTRSGNVRSNKEVAADGKVQALRAARKEIRNIYKKGYGVAEIYRNGVLIETHECSAFTNGVWIKY